jgi:hypothetical protein
MDIHSGRTVPPDVRQDNACEGDQEVFARAWLSLAAMLAVVQVSQQSLAEAHLVIARIEAEAASAGLNFLIGAARSIAIRVSNDAW